MIYLIDTISVWAGRVICLLGLLYVALRVALYLCDLSVTRAGAIALFFKFCAREFRKDPQGWSARIMWGKRDR